MPNNGRTDPAGMLSGEPDRDLQEPGVCKASVTVTLSLHISHAYLYRSCHWLNSNLSLVVTMQTPLTFSS